MNDTIDIANVTGEILYKGIDVNRPETNVYEMRKHIGMRQPGRAPRRRRRRRRRPGPLSAGATAGPVGGDRGPSRVQRVAPYAGVGRDRRPRGSGCLDGRRHIGMHVSVEKGSA